MVSRSRSMEWSRGRSMVRSRRVVRSWMGDLSIMSFSFISYISYITTIVVSMVSNMLGTAIRKSNGIRSLNITISISRFPSIECSSCVVIMHSILILVRSRLLLVHWSRSMVGGSSMDYRSMVGGGRDGGVVGG